VESEVSFRRGRKRGKKKKRKKPPQGKDQPPKEPRWAKVQTRKPGEAKLTIQVLKTRKFSLYKRKRETKAWKIPLKAPTSNLTARASRTNINYIKVRTKGGGERTSTEGGKTSQMGWSGLQRKGGTTR